MTKTRYTAVAVGIVFTSMALGVLSGCDLGDLIRVSTPTDIQKSDNQPSSLDLNDARYEFDQWQQRQIAAATEWKIRIENGERIRSFLAQITLQGLDEYAPALSGIPGVGFAAPAIIGLAGLFVRRPGDLNRTEASREKEKSYNAGLEQGKRLTLEASLRNA